MQEDTGKGKVRSCSKCGGTLASGIKFLLTGWTLHIFCRNTECNSDEVLTLGFKPVALITSALVLVFIFGVVSVIGIKKITAKKTINCDAFKTYDQAKTFYDMDKEKYSYLDRNKNGRPCEDLMI